MKLRLCYFGIVREKLGTGSEELTCCRECTVGDLMKRLADRHDIFALGAGSLRVAVNQEYVNSEHRLSDDDEVAIIPPVSGGSLVQDRC